MNIVISDIDLSKIMTLTAQAYDFDFSGYAPESLKRRFTRLMEHENLATYYEFQYAVTNGHIPKEKLLNEITVNVTDMFRDTEVFQQVVSHCFPYLQTFPRFKIWHAGCSSGQEMYSLAILLKEHSLLSKGIQYGTDINSDALKSAREGVFNLAEMRKYSENYLKVGGLFSLSDYYTAKYDLAKMKDVLKKNMVFSTHDLVKNPSFNEFQLVICRNVLIYFGRELQDQVLQLLVNSLAPYGYLVLGDKESISHSEIKDQLEVVSGKYRIFRKKGHE